MKKVSVCIVNHNDKNTILDTIKSLYEYTKGVELEIFVSDNKSEDGSLDLIREQYPNVIIVENKENIGFGAGNNAVLDKIDSDYHILVNPDIEITYDVITQMVEYMEENKDIGILTPTIMNFDNTVQHLPKKKPKFIYLLGGRLSFLKKYRDDFTMANEDIKEPISIDFCTGCFMFLRTSIFKKVNGFDERYFLYFEDADITREVQKYAKTIYNPKFYVYHHWHRASGKSIKFLFIHIISMFKYYFKWLGK